MKERKMPTAYTILFALLFVVAAATWVIPAGEYDYADGAPVPGSYHTVEANPQGVGDALLAAFEGFYDAVDVAVFLLVMGGFLAVVMKTGAIDAGISRIIEKLQGREHWLIPILMLFFGLNGTTYGSWEETMAFYPLLIPVFLAAGYDTLVAVAVVLLGAGAGVLSSTVNPFATGIASGFAGITLSQGLPLRLIQWVLFEGIAIFFVMRYAQKVKRQPESSLVGFGHEQIHTSSQEAPPLTRKRVVVLLGFAFTFLLMIYSVIPFDDIGLPLPTLGWWFPELAALYFTAAVLIGLFYGLGEKTIAEEFVSGSADLVGVAFVIGISRGITVLMNNGRITGTILHWGERALSGSGSVLFILLVFLIYLPLSVLIPSTSGLATLSIPILAPLGQFAGVNSSLIITAFQSASGIVNLWTPTAGVLMGALALGWVPYDKWLKFSLKPVLCFLLLTAALLALAAL